MVKSPFRMHPQSAARFIQDARRLAFGPRFLRRDFQSVFDDHTLDAERRELLRGDVPIPVQPQVFDLLVCLVQNRDHVVSKKDLIALVWGGRTVSDSTFTSRINAARMALGDSGREQKLLRTIPRTGLRFVVAVSEPSNGTRPRLEPPSSPPPFPHHLTIS